jgi:hypothetical protein
MTTAVSAILLVFTKNGLEIQRVVPRGSFDPFYVSEELLSEQEAESNKPPSSSPSSAGDEVMDSYPFIPMEDSDDVTDLLRSPFIALEDNDLVEDNQEQAQIQDQQPVLTPISAVVDCDVILTATNRQTDSQRLWLEYRGRRKGISSHKARALMRAFKEKALEEQYRAGKSPLVEPTFYVELKENRRGTGLVRVATEDDVIKNVGNKRTRARFTSYPLVSHCSIGEVKS